MIKNKYYIHVYGDVYAKVSKKVFDRIFRRATSDGANPIVSKVEFSDHIEYTMDV